MRSAFAHELVQDLSNATGLAPDNFDVKNLSAGSIIADVEIYTDSRERGPTALWVGCECASLCRPHQILSPESCHDGFTTQLFQENNLVKSCVMTQSFQGNNSVKSCVMTRSFQGNNSLKSSLVSCLMSDEFCQIPT